MSLRGYTSASKPPAAVRRFLLARTGQTRLAFPAELVRGISDASDTAGPGSHSHVGPNGNTIDALEERFEGLLSGGHGVRNTQMVLFGYDLARWSLCVDEVEGLLDVEARALSPLPPHFHGAERRWFQAVLTVRGQLALVVDGAWMMEGSGSRCPEILSGEESSRERARGRLDTR